jgi:hypothetical protein
MNKQNETIDSFLQVEPGLISDSELDAISGGQRPDARNTDKGTSAGVTVCCWP